MTMRKDYAWMLAHLDEVLTKNPNILKVSVIDEDLPGGQIRIANRKLTCLRFS